MLTLALHLVTTAPVAVGLAAPLDAEAGVAEDGEGQTTSGGVLGGEDAGDPFDPFGAAETGEGAGDELGGDEGDRLLADDGSGAGDEDYFSMDLDNVLERVVVSATKSATTAEKAPAVVSVVTASEIRRAGYRTVGEALVHIPGLSQFDDHVDLNVGVRGFYAAVGMASDVIKLMVNGHPVAFRPISGNWFGFDLINIHAVKRIEVIRGPGSALYGANAFLAVINVVTHSPEELGDGVFAGAASGEVFWHHAPRRDSGSGSVNAQAGGVAGPVGWMVAGGFARADRSGLVIPGLKDIKSDTPKGSPSPGWHAAARAGFETNPASKKDTADTGSVYGLVNLNLGDYGKASADLHWQYRNKGGEWLHDTTLSHKTRIAADNMFARLAYEFPGQGEGFSGEAFVSFARGGPTKADRFVSESSLGVTSRRRFSYLAWHGAVKLNYGFADNRVLTLGAELDVDREDLLQVTRVAEETGEGSKEDGYGDRGFVTGAVYGQALLAFVKGLTGVATVRFDHDSAVPCDREDWDCVGTQTSTVTPLTSQPDAQEEVKGGFAQASLRAALVYAPEEFDFHIKLLFGSSYKRPTPWQLYHTSTSLKGTVGNPRLKPQTADTYEALVGYRISDGLSVRLSVFHMDIKRIVGALKQGASLGARNFDARSAGGELSIDWHWRDRLELCANASYLFLADVTPRQKASETDFVWENYAFNETMPVGQYPQLMASLGASWTQSDWYLTAGFGVAFVGGRNASVLHNQLFATASPTRTYTLPPYARVRASLRSTGLLLLGDDLETIVRLVLQGTAGDAFESGYGGSDVPVLGPRVYLGLTQEF